MYLLTWKQMLQILLSSKLLNESGRINPNAKKILQRNLELLVDITQASSFLYGSEDITIQERIFVIWSNITVQPTCNTCNGPVRFDKSAKRFRDYCSSRCSSNDPNVIEKKRIGWKSSKDRTVEKIKDTKSKSSTESKAASIEKRNLTNIERYGTTNLWTVEQIRDKRKSTNIVKYGTEHASQSDTVKAKISKNHARTLDHIDLSREVLTTLHNEDKLSLSDIARRFGVSLHAVWTRFQQYEIPVHRRFSSYPQKLVEGIIHDTGIEFVPNNRGTLEDQSELDVYIPSKQLAIEVNGIYWHSEQNGKDRRYHLNKTNQCQSQGITLLHFFDSEILNKFSIIKSMILHRLGITERVVYARKCDIVNLDSVTGKTFCDNYHLAGGVYGSSNVALEYEGELVAVIVVSKARFGDSGLEILRYCTVSGTHIPGGFERLFKTVRRMFPNHKIVTFSDCRYSVGNVYEKCGFKYIHHTSPNYWYFGNDRVLHSRQKFQKHKLINVLEVFDPNLTEYQNMLNSGFDRIWDCGNIKWST